MNRVIKENTVRVHNWSTQKSNNTLGTNTYGCLVEYIDDSPNRVFYNDPDNLARFYLTRGVGILENLHQASQYEIIK